MLTLPHDQNGVGVKDLADVYCEEAGDALRAAWRHTCRPGRLTRQVVLGTAGGDLSVLTTRAATRHSLICRCLAFLAKHGITLSNVAPTLDDMKGEAFTLTDGPNSSPITSQLPPTPTADGESATAGSTCTPQPTTSAYQQRNRVLYIPPEHATSYESAEFTSLLRITATRTYRGKHSDTQGQVQHMCEWADNTMLGRQLAANKHLLRHVAHRTPVAHIAAAPRAGTGRKNASRTRTDAPMFLQR
jgi:hypothetical protein